MSDTQSQRADDGRPPVLTAGRRRVVLGVVALALMMVVSAVSGLNVALPDLQRDTGASATEIQWIVDAYTLVFAGLLLIGGAVGDRIGRRPVLLFGIVVFGAAAACGLFVDQPQTLIAIRACMGVGAAAVMPATLSIITSSFPPEERARAVGVWVGVAGGGAVVGLFGSGILLEFFDWSSFFGLNVALAVLALAGTLKVIPDSRDQQPPALDPVGGALSLVLVAGLVFGFIEGPERGWSDVLTVSAFVVGVLAALAFVLWELRREQPLLDPRLFKLRGFSTGTLSMAAQFFASFGFFYIILQYLQYVADLSPLQSALALLPLPAVLIPLARQAPNLALRFGANRIAAAGLLLSAAGMLLMNLLDVDFTYWHLAVALVVFAAGMALASTPATMAITSSLPAGKQGVGSAVNDVSREFGSALGIAILGSVLNGAYSSNMADAVTQLPAKAAAAAQSSLAAVQQAAPQLGDRGEALLAAGKQSFVDATGSAFLVAAAVLFCCAVVVFLRAPDAHELRETQHQGEKTPAP
ncbi:MFS transporter [Streptomyces sp. NPDC060194]|uniref:MFS transporter n=1 Tax=Streptomyces sp. NPDC060194 TaxID=3347069 RepID=UPI0036603016